MIEPMFASMALYDAKNKKKVFITNLLVQTFLNLCKMSLYITDAKSYNKFPHLQFI